MALINKIDNSASILYEGSPITSNTVSTLLLLPPTITKAVDLPTASIGSTLTYTILVTNVSLGAVTNLPFSDAVPQGSTYIADSFTLNGSSVTPTITGGVINYAIPSIPALGIATITFQVQVVGGEN